MLILVGITVQLITVLVTVQGFFVSNFTNSAMVSRIGGNCDFHPDICADLAKLRMAFVPNSTEP